MVEGGLAAPLDPRDWNQTMSSNRFPSARRLVAMVCLSLGAACLAVGCSNNGGSGDGVIDDSSGPPGGASGSTSSSGGRAGSTSSGGMSNAGRSGTSGGGGGAGTGGGSGGSGGTGGGNAGSAGSGGGTVGSAGSGGGTAGAGGGIAGSGGSGGSVVSLTCGNGTIESGETCDVPSTDTEYGRACSNTCYKVATQACVDCENDGVCSDSVDNCLGPDGSFTAEQRTLCFSVMHCIEASNCLDGTGSLGLCYCGSLSTMACGAAPFTGPGSPNGTCVKEIQASMPSVSANSAMLASLTAKSLPGGAAMQRLNCAKTADSAACFDTCGFTTGGPAYP